MLTEETKVKEWPASGRVGGRNCRKVKPRMSGGNATRLGNEEERDSRRGNSEEIRRSFVLSLTQPLPRPPFARFHPYESIRPWGMRLTAGIVISRWLEHDSYLIDRSSTKRAFCLPLDSESNLKLLIKYSVIPGSTIKMIKNSTANNQKLSSLQFFNEQEV